MNITFGTFKEFVSGFAWCLKLGKEDTEHIKGEIEDLLNHSSQSLKPADIRAGSQPLSMVFYLARRGPESSHALH